MNKKEKLIQEMINESGRLYVTPSMEDISDYLNKHGYIGAYETLEEDFYDDIEGTIKEIKEGINECLDTFTEESIEKKMLKDAGGNSRAWWDKSNYDELIDREITDGNFKIYEEAKEHVDGALAEGSIIEVQYGYVINPL